VQVLTEDEIVGLVQKVDDLRQVIPDAEPGSCYAASPAARMLTLGWLPTSGGCSSHDLALLLSGTASSRTSARHKPVVNGQFVRVGRWRGSGTVITYGTQSITAIASRIGHGPSTCQWGRGVGVETLASYV
jgi:hypothetical protein